MSIYKKDGHYIVKVSINGKQILRRKYLGRSIVDLDVAKKCERDLYLEYRDLDDDYDINNLFNLFEEYFYKTHKETSAKSCMYDFNKNVKPFFENKKISSLKSGYLEYINDSLNILPKMFRKRDIYLCKSFLIFLSGYGFKGGIEKLYLYKSSRTLVHKFDFYTIDEFNLLFSVIDSNYFKLLFSLLFYYGLRVGELRGLQVFDFGVDRVTISKALTSKGRFSGQKLIDPKSSSSCRSYPYVSNIRELFNLVVKEYKLKSKDFVFSYSSAVIGETTIRRKLAYYCSLCNLKVISIHEFRHSCATYLINNGVELDDIANWLGHSSISTTFKYYAHLLPIRKEKVAKVFDNKVKK